MMTGLASAPEELRVRRGTLPAQQRVVRNEQDLRKMTRTTDASGTASVTHSKMPQGRYRTCRVLQLSRPGS